MKPSGLLSKVHDRTDKSFQFTADFLAAIFTWGGVGWVADRVLGTAPVLMVVGFIVGNSAGIYLLYIRTRDADAAPPRDAHPVVAARTASSTSPTDPPPGPTDHDAA